MIKQYGDFVRVWLGPELNIVVSDPKDVEVSKIKVYIKSNPRCAMCVRIFRMSLEMFYLLLWVILVKKILVEYSTCLHRIQCQQSQAAIHIIFVANILLTQTFFGFFLLLEGNDISGHSNIIICIQKLSFYNENQPNDKKES